jgi:hypothetical protein
LFGNALDRKARKERKSVMRVLTQSVLALGFVGAVAIGIPTTTKAQGVSIYGPNVEVDIGARRYPYRRYYNPYDAYAYQPYGYTRPYYRGYNFGCPPRYSVQDGVCKPYRGY